MQRALGYISLGAHDDRPPCATMGFLLRHYLTYLLTSYPKSISPRSDDSALSHRHHSRVFWLHNDVIIFILHLNTAIVAMSNWDQSYDPLTAWKWKRKRNNKENNEKQSCLGYIYIGLKSVYCVILIS